MELPSIPSSASACGALLAAALLAGALLASPHGVLAAPRHPPSPPCPLEAPPALAALGPLGAGAQSPVAPPPPPPGRPRSSGYGFRCRIDLCRDSTGASARAGTEVTAWLRPSDVVLQPGRSRQPKPGRFAGSGAAPRRRAGA